MSLLLRCHGKCIFHHFSRSCSHVPHLQSFFGMLQNHHVLLTFEEVRNLLRRPRETTPELRNVVRPWLVCCVHILTSTCSSRHSGLHFFNISTSKSGQNRTRCCFVHLTSTCASPAVCIFSTAQHPKVLQMCGARSFFICKCVPRSRPNRAQLSISHLATWLCTRRFSEPAFPHSGATWKQHSVSHLACLAVHLHVFSSHSFFSLIFSLLLFSSLARAGMV